MSTLKILQYNLRARPRFFTPWDKVIYRVNQFIKFLETELENLDLIILQEIFDSYALKILKEYFMNKSWFITGSTKVVLISGGILIASKYRFISTMEESFNFCDMQDCLAAKGMCYAKIKINDNLIYNVIGTHLQDGDSEIRDIRKSQIIQMKEFIKNINDKSQLLFVIGDFNLCNNTEPVLFEFLKENISRNIIVPYSHTEISSMNLDYVISVNDPIIYKNKIVSLVSDTGISISDHSMIMTEIYI